MQRGRALEVIDGEVVRLPDSVLVPQMGWNTLSIKREVEILDGISDDDFFYFVHSYGVLTDPATGMDGRTTPPRVTWAMNAAFRSRVCHM